MSLFVRFESIISVKMDTEWRHIHYSRFRVPEHWGELFVRALDDDFSSEAEISIEPGSPEAATIALHVQLLESNFVFLLWVWSKLKHWRIGMTSNNLEIFNSLINLLAHGKSNNRTLISSEEVRFSWSQIPFFPKKLNNWKTYTSLISLKPLLVSSSHMYLTAWKWLTPEVRPWRILSE